MILVADLECNSLHPSIIHMVGILDYITDEFHDYHEDDVAEGLLRLSTADKIIFYNGVGYDVPVIKRLTSGLVTIKRDKIIEVLDLSRSLVKLPNHKLKQWGELFDFPKGDHTDFSKWSPSMSAYCERDCRLTKKVFDLLNEMNVEKGRQNLLEGLI
jgi:hypothetical protein